MEEDILKRGKEVSYKERYYKRCKGIVAKGYIARGKMKLNTVVRYLKTGVEKGPITREDLTSMLSEVENESVESYGLRLNYRRRQDHRTRRKRLRELRNALKDLGLIN